MRYVLIAVLSVMCSGCNVLANRALVRAQFDRTGTVQDPVFMQSVRNGG